MRIGFVLDDTLDRGDGVQQYVMTLGRWLAAEGHEVHYLTGQTKRNDLPNIHSLSKNLKVKFNGNSLSVPVKANKLKIKRVLSADQFDILHIQMPYSPVLAGKIIKLAKPTTAIVATFHIMPYGGSEKFANKFLALITSKSRRRVDQIASVSKAAAKYAKLDLGIDSQIIPNTIDTKLFKNPPIDHKKDRLRIVYLGRLIKRKAPDKLIEAIASLPQNLLNDLEVIIAGKGPMLKKLQKLAAKKRISHVIYFPGFVPEAKKASLLGSADIAVFPSTSGESFGIVLLEAMASGAGVVIAANNPGYRSVLGAIPETLFDPNSISDFSATLLEFINNQAARVSINVEQSILVRKYDVNTVGSQILECYKQAILKHNSLYNK